MGLPCISELSTANGGGTQVCRQRVPDSASCDVEILPDELSPGPRYQCHDVRPPNSPDLNPVDYSVWRINVNKMLSYRRETALQGAL